MTIVEILIARLDAEERAELLNRLLASVSAETIEAAIEQAVNHVAAVRAEREQAEGARPTARDAVGEEKPARRRGRPPGSKNKPKGEPITEPTPGAPAAAPGSAPGSAAHAAATLPGYGPGEVNPFLAPVDGAAEQNSGGMA